MFATVRFNDNTPQNAVLLDRMFRLRKETFADKLKWDVPIIGHYEYDNYDTMNPLYLVWCSDDRLKLYGSMRLMPTTGPTLLYDVFRDTFPKSAKFDLPGIWEGTRMCVDEEAIAADYPGVDGSRAFSLLLLALCECALVHGTRMMISNYEPHLRRIYRRAGVQVNELGRADGYGRFPVCCGAFEVSLSVRDAMRSALGVSGPLYLTNEEERQADVAA